MDALVLFSGNHHYIVPLGPSGIKVSILAEEKAAPSFYSSLCCLQVKRKKPKTYVKGADILQDNLAAPLNSWYMPHCSKMQESIHLLSSNMKLYFKTTGGI